MHRFVLALWASLALVAVGAGGASAKLGASSGSAAAATQGYIVVFQDDVDVDAKLASLSSQLTLDTQFVYEHALKGFAAPLTQSAVSTLRADADVAFVQADGVVHADATQGVQPIAPGETVPPGIRRIESAVGGNVQLKGKTVAVIDTGVDLNHTDLNATNGRDCINAEPAQDDNGHGTHVSGSVGARNQGQGVVGVSPNTKIYAVKVLNSAGSGSFAQVICGIDWVAANAQAKKIKVANMSLSGGGADDQNCGNTNGDAMHKAICNAVNVKKVTFVVAAGNATANFAGSVPAAYNEVLTVTAMADTDGIPGGSGPPPSCFAGNLDDRFASFSNFAAAASNDINHTAAAPGVCVLSTRLGGGVTTMSGTSMASPHVAGTVANCLGHKGAPGPCAGMTPAQIIQKIRADAAAKPLGYGYSGDPNHAPPPGRYYGFLVSNLGY
jgi:subtilisin